MINLEVRNNSRKSPVSYAKSLCNFGFDSVKTCLTRAMGYTATAFIFRPSFISAKLCIVASRSTKCERAN